MTTFRDKTALVAASRSSGSVFLQRDGGTSGSSSSSFSSSPGLLSQFMMTPGLSRVRPHGGFGIFVTNKPLTIGPNFTSVCFLSAPPPAILQTLPECHSRRLTDQTSSCTSAPVHRYDWPSGRRVRTSGTALLLCCAETPGSQATTHWSPRPSLATSCMPCRPA